MEGLGQAIFVLPRGVIPGGASNGSTFTLLSRIHADVQWVENACKENSDFHLWIQSTHSTWKWNCFS